MSATNLTGSQSTVVDIDTTPAVRITSACRGCSRQAGPTDGSADSAAESHSLAVADQKTRAAKAVQNTRGQGCARRSRQQGRSYAEDIVCTGSRRTFQGVGSNTGRRCLCVFSSRYNRTLQKIRTPPYDRHERYIRQGFPRIAAKL
jgi:hypothetical protein